MSLQTDGNENAAEATATRRAANGRVSTGINGLDEILKGGLIGGRSYLVRGGPGSGKTTLGMHFLTNGCENGEPALFISLSEPAERLRENAGKLGLDARGITFLDLSPDADCFSETQSYDLFSAAEVEREPTTRKIIAEVERLHPTRVFIDSLTQFRYRTKGDRR